VNGFVLNDFVTVHDLDGAANPAAETAVIDNERPVAIRDLSSL
jgi:hypothetical protein